MRFHCLAAAVETEDLGAPGGGEDQAEEEPDGRRLPGTVRAEVPDDLAFGHFEVQVPQGVDRAVALGQPLGSDGWHSQIDHLLVA